MLFRASPDPRCSSLTRRQLLGGGAAALALACGGGAKADPTYQKALPGPDQVDGKLSARIAGGRRPASYTMDPPAAVKGAAEPLVTIVEYSDFQCPHCGTLAAALDELVGAYPDDVRIVFRQFPLGFHKQAEAAARAALAAGRQQRFWAMHDLLFANRARLGDAALAGYAAQLGLDQAEFARDFEDPALAERVAAELAQGKALGVTGTPAMFINGFLVAGMREPGKLVELIEGERAVAESLLEAGAKRSELYARFMRAAGAQ